MKTFEEWQQETGEQLARIWSGVPIDAKRMHEMEEWADATAKRDLAPEDYERIMAIHAIRKGGQINVHVDYRPAVTTAVIGPLRMCVSVGCDRKGVIGTRIGQIGDMRCVEHWLAHNHINDDERAALRHYFTEGSN